MRFVVTGGSGLIGRALIDLLVAEGHDVVVLSRSPERVHGLPASTLVARWDGRSAGALAPRLEGAHGVVHLAGASIGDNRWTARRKQVIRQSRVRSTEAVAQALQRTDTRPGVLIQASAVGYYGPCGDEVVDERSKAGSGFLADVCREWEDASCEVENYGVRRCVVRTGVVLAPRGGALPRMLLPFRFFAGGRLGSGRQWVPWIHLSDEARAIRFLMASDEASGAFNLTAPEPVTNRALAVALGRALGRPSIVPTPGLVLRAVLGEMATLVLDGQRAVPSRLETLGFSFDYPRLEPTLENLLAGSEP